MPSFRKRFRIVPQLDQYPQLVELAKRPVGKLLIVAVVFLLGYPMAPESSICYIAPWLLAISFFPGYRRGLVFGATIGSALAGLTSLDAGNIEYLPVFFGVGAEWGQWWVPPVFASLFLAICWITVEVTKRASFALLRRNPAWSALVCFLLASLPLTYLPLPPIVKAAGWALFLVGAKYIWFLAYSLQEARSPEQPSFLRQVSFYQPFWYPSALPIPKGTKYLEKIECRDDHSFALCQLRGVKLLIWAMILNIMVFAVEGFLYGESRDVSGKLLLQWNAGQMHLFYSGKHLVSLWSRDFVGYFPPMDFAIRQIAAGGAALTPVKAWASTITYFLMDLAGLAAVTHAGVAFCRLAGFNALRNVYRPLEATSIADFWNRYYYYYKELLVAVFFYPSYFTLFKKHPRLRLFTATLLAAGLGNTLFHVLLDSILIVDRGIAETFVAYHTFAFYGLVLAIGIFLSQGKRAKRATNKTGWRRIMTSTLVVLFYCLTIIFADVKTHDITVNMRFFLSLFGGSM